MDPPVSSFFLMKRRCNCLKIATFVGIENNSTIKEVKIENFLVAWFDAFQSQLKLPTQASSRSNLILLERLHFKLAIYANSICNRKSKKTGPTSKKSTSSTTIRTHDKHRTEQNPKSTRTI